MAQNILCGSIGGDYCDYWIAGTVANRYGYAQVYDSQFMGPVVKSLAPWYTGDTSHTYLPVFTPAFQLLSLFPAAVGYWVWVVFNTAALFLYLRFFATQLMLMVVRCLPYFMNIVLGQMDVWVTIFIGEFMRAMLDHKPFRAGLWLGGFVLKPQALVIIGLLLLVQRSVRVLSGLATSSVALALISLLMVGAEAFIRMINSWLVFGPPASKSASFSSAAT